MPKYRELWTRLEERNFTYFFIIILMALLLFLSISFNFRLLAGRNVSIEIPPYTKQPVVVGSPAYAMWWGRYFIDIASNISVNTAETKMKLLLAFVRENRLKQMRLNFQDEIDFIKKHEYTQFFIPDEGKWSVRATAKNRFIVQVEGTLFHLIGDKVVGRSKEVYWVALEFNDTVVNLYDFGHGVKKD